MIVYASHIYAYDKAVIVLNHGGTLRDWAGCCAQEAL